MQKQVLLSLKTKKTHASCLRLCSTFTNGEQKLYLFIHLSMIMIILKIIYLHSQSNISKFFKQDHKPFHSWNINNLKKKSMRLNDEINSKDK